MKLDDFVAETLESLIAGVLRAQKVAETSAAKVNPYVGSSETLQRVEFDVELTTAEGAVAEGGFGIFVGPVAAGTKGKSDSSSQTVGRIKFTVPVQLPVHPRSSSAATREKDRAVVQ